MKVSIDVSNRREAEQLRRALADPVVRAFVQVMGELMQLPNDTARLRVLRYVDEVFAERDQRAPVLP